MYLEKNPDTRQLYDFEHRKSLMRLMYSIKIIKAGCGPVAFQIIQKVLRRQIVYMEVQVSLSSSFISDLRDIGSISLACLLFLLD